MDINVGRHTISLECKRFYKYAGEGAERCWWLFASNDYRPEYFYVTIIALWFRFNYTYWDRTERRSAAEVYRAWLDAHPNSGTK